MTPPPVVGAPRGTGVLLVLIGAGALAVAAAGALAVGFWVLSGSDSEPVLARPTGASRSAPAPEAPAPVLPPELSEPAAPPIEPAPAPPSYGELAADVAAHAGLAVSFSGVVANVESGEGAAFLLFVAEPGCGGQRACGLWARGGPLAPPPGQAVRVHGRLDGSHRYRTRSGAEREVPALAVERLELLRELDAPVVADAERPPAPARAPAPRAEPRLPSPSVAPAQIAPRPLPPPVRPPVGERTIRPVVSADEI